ncbi:MAG: hypothetical protein KDB75_11365 [Flavobacteriales bacterium]|nr:hypothetical protein [Flavobacteriales bacterium]
MEERFIRVPRTARYHVLGDPATARMVWVVLHGYGQLARFFLNKFEGLEDGLLIAAPEGLSRFYLDAQHQRVGATWMTREDREHEIGDQLSYLDALAASLLDGCPQAEGLGVLGFSQGVATACRWTALGKANAQHLVLWGGSMPPDLDRSLMRERWGGMQVHLVQGEKDELVPEEVVRANAAILQRAQVEHSVHHHAGGHALDAVLLGRLLVH